MPVGLETESDQELVDALVEVIDIRRSHALDRLRSVLDERGLLPAFNAELYVSGTESPVSCDCGLWI